MNNVTEKAFSLAKVKKLKGGGLDVHYEVAENNGSETYNNKYHVENVREVHPDMTKLFDDLKPIVAQVFGMLDFKSTANELTIKGRAEQSGTRSSMIKEHFDALEAEILSRIDVTGIVLSGADNNVGAIIKATYKTPNNMVAALNTPRLKFDMTYFGFEGDLEKTAHLIEVEVFEYLFKGKQAQLELFGESGND